VCKIIIKVEHVFKCGIIISSIDQVLADIYYYEGLLQNISSMYGITGFR